MLLTLFCKILNEFQFLSLLYNIPIAIYMYAEHEVALYEQKRHMKHD
jgi:hypothetical protein